MVCNGDFWNSLSDADKEIFLQVGKEVGDEYVQKYRDRNEELLYNGHLTVIEPDEAFMSELKAVGRQLAEELAPQYDAAIMEKVMTYMDERDG